MHNVSFPHVCTDSPILGTLELSSADWGLDNVEPALMRLSYLEEGLAALNLLLITTDNCL